MNSLWSRYEEMVHGLMCILLALADMKYISRVSISWPVLSCSLNPGYMKQLSQESNASPSSTRP